MQGFAISMRCGNQRRERRPRMLRRDSSPRCARQELPPDQVRVLLAPRQQLGAGTHHVTFAGAPPPTPPAPWLDHLARVMVGSLSRRAALRGLAGGLAAALLGACAPPPPAPPAPTRPAPTPARRSSVTLAPTATRPKARSTIPPITSEAACRAAGGNW